MISVFKIPMVQAMLTVILLRMVGIAHFYLSRDATAGPLNMIPVSMAYHSAVLLLFLFIFIGFARLLPFLYQRVEPLLFLFPLCFLILGEGDFLILRQIGQHLTPSVIMTFGLTGVFDPNSLGPLLNDTGFTLTSFGILFLGLAALGVVMIFRKRRISVEIKDSSLAFCFLLVIALGIGVFTDRSLQQAIVRPPEVAFIQRMLGLDRTPPPDNEMNAKINLENFIPVSENSTIQGNPQSQTSPDVILLVVESLRAANLGFISGPSKAAHTPNLDRLSRQGVVFSQFMANGFPSSAGFFSLNTGLWPHPSRIALTDLTDIQVPSLPGALKKEGYRTKIFWGVNPDYDNQLTWARRWYDDLYYQVPGNVWKHNRNMGDATLVETLIHKIRKHDQETAGQPLFIYAATAGTHVPFTLEDFYFADETQKKEAEALGLEKIKDPQERYKRVLQLLDRHIGRLWEALQTRKRKDNTILIIIGDHSIPARDPDSFPEGRPLGDGKPENDYLWTGALILGPEKLIGPPRKETFPASQVDLMPTILRWTGNINYVVGNGTGLFDALPRSERVSVSFREGGYRVNRDGYSLIVDANNPGQFTLRENLSSVRFPNAENVAREAKALFEAGEYWKYLLEQDRVNRN